MNNKFEKFQLNKDIINALNNLGYIEPTQIQIKAIPIILEGKSIVAKSKTGSGKTAAFGIPICQMVSWEENAPQALILEPTRELAVQVKEEIFNIGRRKRLKVPVLLGGMPVGRQALELKQKSHIVIGTPGRVLDHIRRSNFELSKINFLVIDEADLMLNMGFIDEVKTIIEALPKSIKIYLFSATMEEEIKKLANEYLYMPEEIIIESERETVDEIQQSYFEVEEDNKVEELIKVLIAENPNTAMIFCATREMVNVLCRKLKKENISCNMIHGQLEQRLRLKNIEDFRNGKYKFLIATDIAARGVDFDNISLVINYDFPYVKETYVHRVGRTGRNGKSGKAISIITNKEKKYLKQVEEYINMQIKEYVFLENDKSKRDNFFDAQSKAVIINEKKQRIDSGIVKLEISGGKKSKMRAGDVVGSICSINGICQEDIGVIDIRESSTYVEILNSKGNIVLLALRNKTIKGKIRKIKVRR